MSALLTAPPQNKLFPSVRPILKLWTVEQFHYLGDLGIFEGNRAMLVDGIILEEGPINPPHRIALEMTDATVRVEFGTGWRFCIQMPLVLGYSIDPQPDVAIIRGSVHGASTHPSTADLVIEISDTSLAYDTNEKLHLYAASLIREYWVVDVNARQLLVFRDPVSDANSPRGFLYSHTQTLNVGETIVPLACPTATIAVADLLP